MDVQHQRAPGGLFLRRSRIAWTTGMAVRGADDRSGLLLQRRRMELPGRPLARPLLPQLCIPGCHRDGVLCAMARAIGKAGERAPLESAYRRDSIGVVRG